MTISVFHMGKLRLREVSQLPKEHPEWGLKSRSLTPKPGFFPCAALTLGISHHHLRTSHLLSHLSRKTKTLPTGQVQEEMCRLVFSLPAGVHRSVSISGPEARPSERSQGPCGNQFISFYSLLSTTFSMVSLKALGKKRVCCLVSVLKGSWLGRGD